MSLVIVIVVIVDFLVVGFIVEISIFGSMDGGCCGCLWVNLKLNEEVYFVVGIKVVRIEIFVLVVDFVGVEIISYDMFLVDV